MDEINLFQKKMSDNLIDAYIITSNDPHLSEYISDYFKAIQFLTGFTGDEGTLIITKERAYLWVESKFYLQAEIQTENAKVDIMKSGHAGVPTPIELLKDYFSKDNNKTLGFDSKLVSTEKVKKLFEELPNVIINKNTDIINVIWDKRPNLPFSLVYKLSEFFSGRKYKDKLNEILEQMKDDLIDMHIITSLEDQAWLYNLRGNDINHNPVFLSYTVITPEETTLFINTKKIDNTIDKYLKAENIKVREYSEFYEYLKYVKNKKILIDLDRTNYEIFETLNLRQNVLVNKPNPSTLLKAIKNKAEIKNLKIAHQKDGVALTKLMYYFKKNLSKGELTEMSVAEQLEEYKKKIKGYIDSSFETISAFNGHASMIHYSPTNETNSKITGNGLLLLDSGSHYMEGTTDVTRTFVVGKLNDKMKTQFTTVLKAMIALNRAIFLKGTTGLNLDILAREPIWNIGMDYKCKTGHGVGYLLSIHEGPNNFYWKQDDKYRAQEILPGMVTTNEPGIYVDGSYGIRIENELLCVEKNKTEFGEFYGFETLTLCPIDLDAIKVSILTKEEKEWLNDYHQRVYDEISPSLNEEEKEWLQEYTKKI